MSFEPVYKDLSFNCKQKLCKTQSVVETRIIPPHGATIARVLCINARCVMGNAEVFAGEVRYTGRACFKVLFVDGEGANRYVESNVDFSDKIECSLIKSDSFVFLRGYVLDTDVINVSQGEIKLASVIEITLDGDVKNELHYLSNECVGLYTEVKQMNCSTLVAHGNGVATASNTVEKVKLTDISFAEHKVVVKSRVAGTDIVRVEGVIISEICGQTDDGLLCSATVETPFSEEMGAIGARFGDSVVARAKVSGNARVERNDDICAVVVDYDLNFSYCVYEKTSCDVVTDAFSATHELNLEFAKKEITCVKQGVTLCDRVEGNVTLDANMPIVDNILTVTALALNVTNALSGDGEVLVEGIVSGNVIYYSAEANSKNSVAIELPFSLKLNASEVQDDDEINAWGEVTAVNAKIRRGNEIDIRIDVAIETEVSRKSEVNVVCAVNQGEMREVRTCAYSMHIAKSGETLWETAKALCSTPEVIMEQNSEITLPFKGGEKVIIYRHLNK